MSTINLSPSQELVVKHINGPILVKASAGSGKTRVLTERIKAVLNVTKRKILAITYTNKAGDEMKHRLGDLNNIKDKIFIGTFHGFCQQVLESHGKLIGLQKMPQLFEDETDRIKLIEEALDASPSYQKRYLEYQPKEKTNFLYNVMAFISEVKRQLISEEELFNNTQDGDLVMIYKAYQDILSSQNAIDFDDLIMLTYNLFASNPSIAGLYRRSYEFICIDEAQDLNNAQYQLLKIITGSEHKNVMMVGDPNQSIFAFNGSSSDFMIKSFVEDFSPTIVDLKENYRSSKAVLNAAEKIIPNASNIQNTIIDGIFEIYNAADEIDEANWVTQKIKHLIETKNVRDIEGDICYEKIAVLARNKYVFTQLEKVFKSESVDFYYKITPGSIRFESMTMRIFDMALRVKLNNQDILHFRRLKELLGINSGGSLTDILNNTSINELQKEIINTVILLGEEGEDFKTSLEKLCDYIKNSLEIDDDNEKNMIVNDINEILIHWHNYSRKTDNKSLNNFKNSMALGQTHPMSQPKGVTLSTIHTMKGQEYDIVFVIGLDEETFPDYRALKKGGIEMTQEKNNLYVAFTRSKRYLFATWPANKSMPWGDIKKRTISRFLKDF